jgi:hypothetical protein
MGSVAVFAVLAGQLPTTGGAVQASPWPVAVTYPAVAGFSAIACPASSTCVTVGENSSSGADVLSTFDCGVQWTPDTVPSGLTRLSGVAPPTMSECSVNPGRSGGTGE